MHFVATRRLVAGLVLASTLAACGGGGGGGGGGRRGGATGVPFVAGGGRGGFGGGALVDPGTYMVKVTIGDKVLQTSVNVLEDIWMRPQ